MLIIGAIALVVTWSPLGYRAVRHLATLLHEAGHAITAVLVGRNCVASGCTRILPSDAFAWQTHRPRHDRHAAGRLPRPAVVGLAGAWLLGRGFAAGTLWALVLLCAEMWLCIRNFYGLWVVLVTGVGVGALSWLATGTVISIAAYLMVWGLLFIAPRAVVDLQRSRRRKRGRSDSDADQLARLTRMPAGLWVGIFWLLTAACLAAGGWLLMTTG